MRPASNLKVSFYICRFMLKRNTKVRAGAVVPVVELEVVVQDFAIRVVVEVIVVVGTTSKVLRTVDLHFFLTTSEAVVVDEVVDEEALTEAGRKILEVVVPAVGLLFLREPPLFHNIPLIGLITRPTLQHIIKMLLGCHQISRPMLGINFFI